MATVTLEDREVLDRARRAVNGGKFARLYGDSAHDGEDDSALDAALCSQLAFWTGRQAEQMDRLFCGSARMRLKWDEHRGAQTYGAMTIARAITWCNKVYDPTRPTAPEQIQAAARTDALEAEAAPGIEPFPARSLMALLSSDIALPQYLSPWNPAGHRSQRDDGPGQRVPP